MEEPTNEEIDYYQGEEYRNFVRERDSNQLSLEAWKESIDYAKHWEPLVFESAKNYFTVIACAIAGAGAAVAWPSIDRDIQKYVVLSFLILSFLLSVAALFTIKSQKKYFFGREYQ